MERLSKNHVMREIQEDRETSLRCYEDKPTRDIVNFAMIALKKLLMIFRRTIPEIQMKWNGGSRLLRKCQKNIILYLQNGKAQNIGAMQCLKRDPMRFL